MRDDVQIPEPQNRYGGSCSLDWADLGIRSRAHIVSPTGAHCEPTFAHSVFNTLRFSRFSTLSLSSGPAAMRASAAAPSYERSPCSWRDRSNRANACDKHGSLPLIHNFLGPGVRRTHYNTPTLRIPYVCTSGYMYDDLLRTVRMID